MEPIANDVDGDPNAVAFDAACVLATSIFEDTLSPLLREQFMLEESERLVERIATELMSAWDRGYDAACRDAKRGA